MNSEKINKEYKVIKLLTVVFVVFLTSVSCKANKIEEVNIENNNKYFKDIKISDVKNMQLSYVRYIYSADEMKEFIIPLDMDAKNEIFIQLKNAKELLVTRTPKCLNIDGVKFLLDIRLTNEKRLKYEMSVCFS